MRRSRTSFHSQISSVFKVPGKQDLYIALADRWLPGYMDLEYQTYADAFEARFAPDCGKNAQMPDCVENTSIADYVWLPLRFEGEMVYLDWRDEWSLDEYE